MKKMLIHFILTSSLFSAMIQPSQQYIAPGSVTDIVYKDKKLYAATDASAVCIFDTQTGEILQTIKVDPITDFMGDLIDSKVYSVDVIENKILILSQANKGARRVHIYENNLLKLILPYTQRLFIAKAKFIDKNTILLGLLSSELISYDIATQTKNYTVQVSGSKFSNFVLNEAKDEVIIADESGNLKLHHTKDGQLLKELRGKNLDNVFQVDTKKGIIITAGQDRRAVVYNPQFNSTYYKKSNFLIYSAGLSPSGKIAGFSSDEQNNVTVFNTKTKKDIATYTGNKMTLSNILFINEKEMFVSSDDSTINLYKIK